MNINKPKYFLKTGVTHCIVKFTKKEVTKDSINNFIILSNRRDIKSRTVNSLVKILMSGQHFETPIMTNLVKNEHRLLDGNHRIEACKKFFNKFPSRKIELWIGYYENLNETEEKEIYTKWNLGKRQSINDFVTQYWNDITIAKFLQQPSFPHNIAPNWSTNQMEFKFLIQPYLDKLQSPNVFNGGYSKSAYDFILDCKNLDQTDVNVIKSFLVEYISIFGNPIKKSPFYKQSIFSSIFRIWLDNCKNTNPAIFKKHISKLIGTYELNYWCRMGGSRENNIQCRKAFLEHINHNRKTPLLI